MAERRPQAGDVYRRRCESFRVKVTAIETSGPRRWVCFRRIPPNSFASKERVGLVMFLRRFEEVPHG